MESTLMHTAFSFVKRCSFVLIYAGIALLIVLPWLKPGYILTLDMVFTPHMPAPSTVTSSYLLRLLLHLLNLFIPGEIIEKLIIFTIFLLSGTGMHRLVHYIRGAHDDLPQRIGAYASGIVFMINPFTYDRLMAGQYNVLLGYALLPFFTLALLQFLACPTSRRAFMSAAWLTLIGIVSVHTVGLAAILAVLGAAVTAVQALRQREHLYRLVLYGSIAFVIFVIASSYWLVPLAMGKGATADLIAGFSANDQAAFATVGNGTIGQIANVIRLQGFWAESRHMYRLPQAVTPGWGLVALIIWALVITGALHWWRSNRQRQVLLIILTALVCAIVVACGVGQHWLVRIPLLAGYREPEKFVALIALGYAMLVGVGAATAVRTAQEQWGHVGLLIAGSVVLALPFVFTPTLLWGGAGQLRPVRYPAGWFAVDQRITTDRGNFQTLVLPWHLYMYFDFAGRLIANPAPSFFTRPTIVSDNPEFHNIAPELPTPTERSLDVLLPEAARGTSFGEQLAPLKIKYIILTKDDDYAAYAYLYHQQDIQLITGDDTIALFRNESFKESRWAK